MQWEREPDPLTRDPSAPWDPWQGMARTGRGGQILIMLSIFLPPSEIEKQITK